MDSRPVAAAAVVCLKGDCVLLVRRGREPNLGRWSFPGGKIEPGETARQAAERETLEEVGLRVRLLDVVDVYDALFPPYHYCVVDYLAVPVGDDEPAAAGDVLDARWVPISQLDRFEPTEAMLTVLERARWLRHAGPDAPPSLGLDLEPVPPAAVGTTASRRKIEGLYVITDPEFGGGRSHVELARLALAGGARVIQLRDKQRDAGDLLPMAREMAAMCSTVGALFIVNDRVDLAFACGADGVHLGQTDLPIPAARAILGPDSVIGVSVENVEQAVSAAACGADYLGVGPVFGTVSKADAGDPVGLEHLACICREVPVPVVAIGGITRDGIPQIRAAGANAAAVIRAVVAAPDPAQAARELADAWEG